MDLKNITQKTLKREMNMINDIIPSKTVDCDTGSNTPYTDGMKK